MKYVSLVLVAIIVGLSWFLIRPTDSLTAEQHTKLQQVMTEYLAAYLKSTNPSASDIINPQVSTKIVESGKKMQALFTFSFTMPGEGGQIYKVSREGYFNLVSENGQDWTAHMERINDSFTEFPESEGMTISLSDAHRAGQDEEAARAMIEDKPAPQEEPAAAEETTPAKPEAKKKASKKGH